MPLIRINRMVPFVLAGDSQIAGKPSKAKNSISRAKPRWKDVRHFFQRLLRCETRFGIVQSVNFASALTNAP